jgi:TolA-binding protein
MGGNRVEELESKVREMEATVDGLTDELLECKERIEALENEVDPDMDIIEGGIAGSSSSSSSPATSPPPEATDGPESGDGAGSAADSDKTDDDESETGSDADDIIVA